MGMHLTGTEFCRESSLPRDGRQVRHLATRVTASRPSLRDGYWPVLAGAPNQQGKGPANRPADIPFRRCFVVLLKAARDPRAERSLTRYGMLGAINGYCGRCKFNAGPHVEDAIQKRRAA
jgi:hypothetical protein